MARCHLYRVLPLTLLLLGVTPAWAVKVRFTNESYQNAPSRWLLQTGAFKAQDNAQAQVERLKKLGQLSAEVFWDEGRYHVLLSPQKKQARSLLRLIQKSFPDAYLRGDFRHQKGKIKIVGD